MPFLRPVGGGLAERVSVPHQELRQPLLAALQVLAGVVQRAHQVARRLAPVVGDPHLHDVAHRQHARQELRVVAVVLPLAVSRWLDHLRDRADDAVDAQRREPLLQVEPGHARLVDALRGRVEGSHPLCDGRRVVGESGRADLAGHRVKGDGLYGSRVHVEADEGGSIQHERAPFHACGVAATFELDTHIVGLIHGFACSRGSQCFHVLLISSRAAGAHPLPGFAPHMHTAWKGACLHQPRSLRVRQSSPAAS